MNLTAEAMASGSAVSRDHNNFQAIRRNAILFSYRQLVHATNHFSPESRIGEGVHKGQLVTTGQTLINFCKFWQMVAVKELNPDQGNLDEFIVEILTLSLLRHRNIVDFIGFCADEDQRMLVYEFCPLPSLHFHLHESTSEMAALDWDTRMSIADGVAKALYYLHNEAQPDHPVIFRDLTSHNVLLDEGFHPKLGYFWINPKFGADEGQRHDSTRVMAGLGYRAPEYYKTENLTVKADVYSFGVLLLELITGKVALDSLVQWVEETMLKGNRDPACVVDERLVGQYREASLRRATKMALMCVQQNVEFRLTMVDVVRNMDKITSQTEPEEEGQSSGVLGSHDLSDFDDEDLIDDIQVFPPAI
ncbi:hypothetical protein BUALT_Bualt04G0176800 [Buddleja alternifolia]|uniref:Protein kinase domain-containing protein n=1 Tax=Buddleja alternifolia TaxID=168488 RepID=A0AAV6XWI0_9LAMI|nr:hypothetical protein BUALT_Bualt04G0176800 [Buddleja alternifolia]